MEDTPDKIGLLHTAWCQASAQELPMNVVYERGWYLALELGLTPEDVVIAVKTRLRYNNAQRDPKFHKSLALRHILQRDDSICALQSEAHEQRAKMRVKVMPSGKAEVMRSTGRSDALEPEPVKHISEILGAQGWQSVRRAAQ